MKCPACFHHREVGALEQPVGERRLLRLDRIRGPARLVQHFASRTKAGKTARKTAQNEPIIEASVAEPLRPLHPQDREQAGEMATSLR